MVLIVALCIMLGASISPWLMEVASAKPEGASNINMVKRSDRNNSPPFATCKAKFVNVLKDTALLQREFSGAVNQMAGYPNSNDSQIRSWVNGNRTSILNGVINVDDIKYMLAGVGNSYVPTIEFYPTDSSQNPIDSGRPPVADTQNICDELRLIPVNADRWEWRGHQTITVQNGSPATYYMKFTLTSPKGSVTDFVNTNAVGTLEYRFYDGARPPSQTTHAGTVIDGYPDFGRSGGIGTGTLFPAWVDATTIQLPNIAGNGLFGGDIYVKQQWGGDLSDKTAYYMLEKAGSSERATLTMDSGKGCEKPLPEGSACNNGAQNCVPFIAVKQFLDLANDDKNNGLRRLQNDINQLGTAQATLYDYHTDCRLKARMRIPNFQNTENSKIWFYFSEKEESMRVVWPTGSGNETPYLATYTLKNGLYRGGGANDCMGSVKITSTPPPRPNGEPRLFGIQWSLYNDSCQTLFGTINNIYALSDQGKFDDVVTPPGDTATTAPEPRIGCDFFTLNPLNWIVCPFIKGATNVVGYLDDAINRMLTVDVKQVFDDSTATGKAYHTAWGVFRGFALAIIVIAALVMVIAQAAGTEILDAYTVRKVLPRLLIATIGITISWNLMEAAVTLSNDLGNGIRSIIYAPFGAFTDSLRALDNSTKFALVLLGSAGILAYGWVALLSLVVTALLACLVAFFMLAFRRVLITFLAIISPFAIACSILPNTQKVWKLWLSTFTGALLVFLIISAFIATGRVFAVTALASSNTETITQIIALIAYFAPYFLIPYAFRLAGGFIATIGGIVNDRSRGMFDRLKNFRGNEVKMRGQKAKQGELFQGFSGSNRFARMTQRMAGAANDTTVRAGLARGRFGFGRRGRAAYSEAMDLAAQRHAGSDAGKAGQHNDPMLQAQSYFTEELARAGLQRDFGMTATQAEDAITSARANGGFGRARANFAAGQLVRTGTGYANMQQMVETLARVSDGDENSIARLAGAANADTKTVGRHDMAPGFTELQGLVRQSVAAQVSGNAALAPSAAAYREATVLAGRGADNATLGRNKTASVTNISNALSQAIVAHETTANTTTDPGVRAAAEARVAELVAKVENMRDSGMYMPEVNVEVVQNMARQAPIEAIRGAVRDAATEYRPLPSPHATPNPGYQGNSPAEQAYNRDRARPYGQGQNDPRNPAP
ncbi:MAG TPA: hypothetical protein VJ836_07180 [Candidatus Saccharimonadales bacterium]|nr:hypothetical protein [Candidatus Saccharimonadales bacterium]